MVTGAEQGGWGQMSQISHSPHQWWDTSHQLAQLQLLVALANLSQLLPELNLPRSVCFVWTGLNPLFEAAKPTARVVTKPCSSRRVTASQALWPQAESYKSSVRVSWEQLDCKWDVSDAVVGNRPRISGFWGKTSVSNPVTRDRHNHTH